MRIILLIGVLAGLLNAATDPARIDRAVAQHMRQAGVNGLALALIADGSVEYLKTYGQRDSDRGLPLQTDTVMYGASLTKFAFAHLVMQLADQGVVDLDKSIAGYLKKPLPEYEKYADLSADPRWRKLTLRILLNHASGFANFRFIEPDGKLRFHFDPGTRYAYSGEGINLAQFVLEEGLGLDVAKEMKARVFDRFGMKRTSMTWREDFADNCITGYDVEGKAEPHHKRGSVRAAGSMDTTIADYAAFLAAFQRGEGLKPASRAEMLRATVPIASAHQFPTLEEKTDAALRKVGLAAGLGVVVFRSADGPAFFKGGHDDWTANSAVCVDARAGKRCVLVMSNHVRAESFYPALIDEILGAGVKTPWSWEYNSPPLPPLLPRENR